MSHPNIRFFGFAIFAGILVCTAIFLLSCTTINTEDAPAERNKKVVSEAFQVLQDADYDQLDQYIAEDYVRHCQATPEAVVESLDDFKKLLREWEKSFTDIENRAEVFIAEGDLVAFYGSFSGTHTGQMGPFPTTGKKIYSEFAGYHRLADEKIVETWVTWDNIAILQQLGLLPPPAEDLSSK
jgi:predicted ester cyclase